jgi:hypothetical protein
MRMAPFADAAASVSVAIRTEATRMSVLMGIVIPNSSHLRDGYRAETATLDQE